MCSRRNSGTLGNPVKVKSLRVDIASTGNSIIITAPQNVAILHKNRVQI